MLFQTTFSGIQLILQSSPAIIDYLVFYLIYCEMWCWSSDSQFLLHAVPSLYSESFCILPEMLNCQERWVVCRQYVSDRSLCKSKGNNFIVVADCSYKSTLETQYIVLICKTEVNNGFLLKDMVYFFPLKSVSLTLPMICVKKKCITFQILEPFKKTILSNVFQEIHHDCLYHIKYSRSQMCTQSGNQKSLMGGSFTEFGRG